MKNIRPFGPSIGKTKISKNFMKKLNNEFDLKSKIKKIDYSSKLASQIKNEIKFNKKFVKKHYHEGDLSGVGYIKLPKNMTINKKVKNKKLKTNGTIDFINGQKNFLCKSILNVVPKVGDMFLFPNYLMHTAYPFNVEGERRSFSFNIKLKLNK